MKNTIYIPLTAAPFRQDETYREILPQSPELARYIRCFWGSSHPYLKKETPSDTTIVIPDTCADILYYIDYTDNTVTGSFCGINDTSFTNCENTPPGHLISVFAIRFYAWGAYAFSEDSLKGTINGYYDVQSRFLRLDRLLRQQLLEKHSLEERRCLAEEILLRRTFPERQQNAVAHAIHQILSQKGVLSISGLAEECFISGRQLERLFQEYIGITPKKLCNLVRYQYLWNEILNNPRLRILDAVYKYGYTDQAHLMREFKRYHTMDIQTAKAYARHHVGNIQYTCGSPM